MNIWIVNHYALDPSRPGGTRHFSFGQRLAAMGHDVTLIAASYDHRNPTDQRVTRAASMTIENVAGVRFVWLHAPTYRTSNIGRLINMFVFAGRVWGGRWRAQLPKPDVLVGSTPQLFAAYAALRLARRLSCRFVLEVRDIWPQTMVDLGNISRNHPLVLVMKWLERAVYRGAHKIITLLPRAVDHIITFGVPAERVTWVPNGVEINRALDLPPAPERRPFTLMYAGTHGLANGLETALEAARILKKRGGLGRYRIHLVGDGPLKVKLQHDAELLDVADITVFEDAVSKNQMWSKLAEADAYLMILRDAPVFRWGISPNKLFEYMAAGRPVLFGVNTSVNPVSECNAGLVFDAADASSLADAIEQLTALPLAERHAMGARGRAYVTSNHSFANLTPRFLAALCDDSRY